MKAVFLKTFYVLLVFWWGWSAHSAFELQYGWIFFLAALLPLAAAVPFSHRREARASAAVAALMAHQWLFSAGVIGHHSHGWPLAAVELVFISGSGRAFTSRDLTIVRSAQALLLAPYFLSGLWRLLSLISIDGFQAKLNAITEFPTEALAFAVAEGNGPLPGFAPWIEAHPGILLAGFIFFWAFEIFAFVPVLAPRWTRVWGWCAFVFHLSVTLLLSIYFTPMMLSSLFFLVLTEEYLKLGGDAP